MNVSGRAVKALLTKKPLPPHTIVVVYDDADIEFGTLRWRERGSSGGHNGMQSILDLFPPGIEIPRLRVGIGRPENTDLPLDAFVLQPWTAQEQKELPVIISRAADLLLERIA